MLSSNSLHLKRPNGGIKFALMAISFSLASAIVIPKPSLTERQITRLDPADCPEPSTTKAFQWDTKDCTETYFANWAQPIDSWANAPTLNVTIAGVPITATVDTGSTSLVANIHLFPNVTFQKNVQASVFYSSSHWLEEGYEEWIDMAFGPYGIRTKIIVKENEVCCPTFNSAVDGHRCPKAKLAKGCICSKTCKEDGTPLKKSEKRETVAPLPVAYMGIGFGRGDPPNENAFLDTISFNGQPLSASSSNFCQGYIITHNGLYLGLNKQLVENFAWTGLGTMNVGGLQDYSTPGMVYNVDNGTMTDGTVLVDTGIPNSYFTGTPGWAAGKSVFEVSIPGVSQLYTVKYDMSEGLGTKSPNPMQPIAFGVSSKPGYLNTGRKLLNCFDIAYDSVGGNFGYRYLGDTDGATGCSKYVSVAGSVSSSASSPISS